MGQCEAQIFDDITAEQFEKLQAKAKTAGIPLEGASGEATKMGIHLAGIMSRPKGG